METVITDDLISCLYTYWGHDPKTSTINIYMYYIKIILKVLTSMIYIVFVQVNFTPLCLVLINMVRLWCCVLVVGGAIFVVSFMYMHYVLTTRIPAYKQG